MKRDKLWTVLSALFLIASLLSGCAAKTEGTGVLRVGVRDDIMNFGYLNETTGNYYGFEIDLASRLASELGYARAEFVAVQPENREEILKSGQVDCLIAAYSISDSRQEMFDFSPAYYTDQIKIMVENSSLFETMTDLRNKKVGVLSGTNTALEFAVKMHDMGLIREFDQSRFDASTFHEGVSFFNVEHYADLDLALEQGMVDAVTMDGCIIQAYKTDDRRFLDVTLSEQHYGVATQKGSRLSQPVADAVQKLLDDGTIAALIDKWD